jgi:hypothetical protein
MGARQHRELNPAQLVEIVEAPEVISPSCSPPVILALASTYNVPGWSRLPCRVCPA